jgi:hypothetical protein
MDSRDAKKLKQLEDANRKLKHVVAELALERPAVTLGLVPSLPAES